MDESEYPAKLARMRGMERHGSIREEVVRRGREIYERSLSYELEPERLGELEAAPIGWQLFILGYA